MKKMTEILGIVVFDFRDEIQKPMAQKYAEEVQTNQLYHLDEARRNQIQTLFVVMSGLSKTKIL